MKPRVLLVDDDRLDRTQVREAIGQSCELLEASSVAEAVELMRTVPVDVVMFDDQLPPHFGAQVLRALTAAAPRHTAFVLLAGPTDEEVIAEVIRAGASEVVLRSSLVKPFRVWRSISRAVEVVRLRREAEAASQRSREAQARLTIGLESAGAGTWEWANAERVLKGDARVSELLEVLPGGEVQFDSRTLIARLHPEDREAFAHFLASLPGTWATKVPSEVKVRVPLPKGEVRWVDFRGRAHSQTGCFGIATDVTETEARERHHNELRERLIGIVGHDLKNPLNAVLLAVRLLGRADLDEKKRERYVQQIKESADRMTAIVVQLLDLTRAQQADLLRLQLRRFNLTRMVRELANELMTARPDRSIDVTGPEIEVDGDPDRLGQAVSNLLGNAIRHGDPRGPVGVELSALASEAWVAVTNGGEPIPPEQVNKLFQPFTKGSRRSSSEGLGLGLFIAHQFVTAHRGGIDVSSTRERTRFTLRVPLTATTDRTNS